MYLLVEREYHYTDKVGLLTESSLPHRFPDAVIVFALKSTIMQIYGVSELSIMALMSLRHS